MKHLAALLALLASSAVLAQTASVEQTPAPFTARTIAPDGSAIGGGWTLYHEVEAGGATYYYFQFFPAVWVDGQVHRLNLPPSYTPPGTAPVRSYIIAVSEGARVIYGYAQNEVSGDSSPSGIVRWDGVDGAMTLLEGLTNDSQMLASSPDGSVIAGYGRLSDDPLSGRGGYRWENGVRTELQGYGPSRTDSYSIHGVTEDGRVLGARVSGSEPYHAEAVWWEPDGQLVVGPNLGPWTSIDLISGDGSAMFRTERTLSSEARPAERYRDGEVIQIGHASIVSPVHTTSRWGYQSQSSWATSDGSRVYANGYFSNPGSGMRGGTGLWIEGVGWAPVREVLAERYGVALPPCSGYGDLVLGMMSPDGRVLTAECPETLFFTGPEHPVYRITLPAEATWAEATDGFFDEPDRWAPALVPDSTTLTSLASGGPYTVTLRESHAAGPLTISDADANLALGAHTLTLGTADSASAPPALRVGVGAPASLGLDQGTLRVRGGMTVGEGGDGTGQVFVARGHALEVAGRLVVGAEATDGRAGEVIVAAGSVQAAGGIHLGVGEGATGRIEALSDASIQATARTNSIIGGQGEGQLYADGAFVSLTGSLTLGGGATGQGQLELSNGAFALTTGDLFVGLGGSGTVGVASGATLSTGGLAVVGGEEGTTSTASVNGAGSRWDVVNSVLAVGTSGGYGLVLVTDGGALCVADEVIVGERGAVISDSPLQVREGTDCTAAPSASASAAKRGGGGLVMSALTVEGAGELDAPSIEVGPGGAIGGSGALTVPVVNEGTLAPGGEGALGTLSLSAPLTLASGGALAIEVGADSADALVLTQPVALGGVLRLGAASGETPTVGARYDVLTAPEVTGTFDRIDVPEGLDVEVTPTAVVVRVTGAVDAETAPEAALALDVYPNPTRGAFTARFALPDPGEVHLVLVDALGREVAVLASGEHAAGEHTAALSARGLAPGVYAAVLTASGERSVQRLTVAR